MASFTLREYMVIAELLSITYTANKLADSVLESDRYMTSSTSDLFHA